jgi:hypothetical protein
MDVMTVYEVLINAGPMGLFAAYLVYTNSKHDKRLEENHALYLTKLEDSKSNFLTHLEEQERKFLEREDKLRDKYDTVIVKLDGERKEILERLVTTLQNNNVKIGEITTKIEVHGRQIERLGEDLKKIEGKIDHFAHAKFTKGPL